MLKFDTIRSADEQFVMQTYKRLPALFVQGAGCSLWDNRGNEYLDLLAGIAVCNLGHCHPAITSAITRQAQQLIHVSNFGLTAPQAQLAKRLCELSGMERVFFTTCGATANETAIKIAKKHGLTKRPDGDYEIITLHRSFHGRTLGALSATGQRKYQRPFEPLIPGFRHVEVNDLTELKEAVGHKTAAILLEPIQGEGGVMPLTSEYLQLARDLCDEFGALLMLDEVQTGIGRTGEWFCYQIHGVQPDVMCLAKGLGGGVPVGACLARGKAAELLEPGDHGATFGGNPLSCSAGLAVLDAIEHYGLRQNTKDVGAYLAESLRALGAPIKEVRGYGLMIGAILHEPVARGVVAKAFDKRLIINATDEYSLRFVPPLILTYAQVDQAMSILADVLNVPVPAVNPVSAKVAVKPRYHDILKIDDLNDSQLEEVLDLAAFLKQRRKLAPSAITPIEGRSVALVFEKPSLRTRVSFETAIRELGGHPIYLSKADIGLNTRESAKDIASNLARWCSMIVARLYWQRDLELLADIADVPVINALTELEHPCQALADVMTVQENFGQDKVKITYVGDGNNVSRSLARAATRLGYPVTICGPANFRLEEMPGLHQTDDLEEGLADAKVVYTDVWISMGDEHEQEHRLKVFDAYQVNSRVMEMADKAAVFLHCLPARRGYEVTDDVIDGKQSRVVDQAENRLHAQKALLQLVSGW
ncbi:MAG TPA: acetylornithine transaminase [Fimbriimonadaceae bacterium]|nr:acetylornithine transaminase [Fimbriimonadaceae bacterium]